MRKLSTTGEDTSISHQRSPSCDYSLSLLAW